MRGMELMLKSMGLDPDKLKTEFEQTISIFNTRISNVENQLNKIEANQVLLYQLLQGAGVIPTVEEHNARRAQLEAENGPGKLPN